MAVPLEALRAAIGRAAPESPQEAEAAGPSRAEWIGRAVSSGESRRGFLRTLVGAAAALAAGCRGSAGGGAGAAERESTMPEASRSKPEARPSRMPVLFVGHGSPMNVIEDNRWSRGFAVLRDAVPRPKAILAISAHWFVDGTYLTGSATPETIHDFYGFPQALFDVDYPAPGRVDLAERVRRLLGKERAALRTDWGLDHGTWSVLRWMYPAADVPVVQLSLDRRLDARSHVDLARALAPLRDEGVLILGSGNIVHNLGDAGARMQAGDTATPAWAREFDTTVAQALSQRDTQALVAAWPDSEHGRRAHPSPDHWWPLLYAYAATDHRDAARFPIEGFDWGSISMRAVRFG